MSFAALDSRFLSCSRGLGTERHQGETGQAAGKDHACLYLFFRLFFPHFFVFTFCPNFFFIFSSFLNSFFLFLYFVFRISRFVLVHLF